VSYVVDTNVASELRRKARTNAGVRAWADSVPDDLVYLSVVSLLEIEQGISRVSSRDPAKAAHLRRWVDHQLMPQFDGRILPVDVSTVQACMLSHPTNPRTDHDALIAATARAHGFMLVTRNTADFAGMGVQLLNPFTP
jgi:toxin FitB